MTGTDATHAEHIETIKSRMYVGLTADQRFLPGELGMGLVEGMYAHTHTAYQIIQQVLIHADIERLPHAVIPAIQICVCVC